MSNNISAFNSTVQTTHIWINEVLETLGWEDTHRGYLALRAVLHALRDRLSVDGVAALGAQLPMLVRGFFYEGWHPHGKPLRERKKEKFLAHIQSAFRPNLGADVEQVTQAVFRVLANHVSDGEIEKVKHMLPPEIRSLWQEPVRVMSL